MKKIKKGIVLLLAMVLMISVLPVQAEAANKVKINKTNATVYVGSSTTLKISGTKAKVKWSTSNKKIATVSSNGKVTGKKAGNATITAKVGKKSYKCKVTVENPYLNKTKLSINVGQTYQLKITGTKASKWSSSKESVATVNSKGKVTAKKAGKTTITCKGNDGKSYKCTVTVKEKHTHKYTSKVTKKATCTSEGVKTYTCSCGDSYTESIAKTAHTWDSGTVSGTTKTYKCTVCGKKKTETVECQHKNTEVRNKQSATCGHTGYTGDTYCKDCGKKISSGKKIAKTAHSWNNGKVTSKATCSNYGTKTYTCTVCGEEKDEDIEPLPHKYIKTVVNPTCTEQGYTEYKCSVCGYSYVDNYKNELGHDYRGTQTKAATCTKEGIITYTCSRCNESYTESISKIGHVYIDTIVSPTCAEQGYTEHKCSVCGDSYKDNYVDALGHDFGEGVVKKEATDYSLGVKIYTCTRCMHSEEHEYALPHDVDLGNGKTATVYGYWDLDVAAEVFELLNEYRVENGLDKLQKIDILDNYAQIRALESCYYFNHNRPNGTNQAIGLIEYNLACGENIASGYVTANVSMSGWKKSSEHNANMLEEGYVYGSTGVFREVFYKNNAYSVVNGEFSNETPIIDNTDGSSTQNFAYYY